MILYILVYSTISVSDDVRFVHHKCDGPTETGVIYSSAGRGFTPCFMVSVVQFLVFLASVCWPVFYGECCSVFSIFGQFLLTSVFAYFLLAIALSCLTSICVFWLFLRYCEVCHLSPIWGEGVDFLFCIFTCMCQKTQLLIFISV